MEKSEAGYLTRTFKSEMKVSLTSNMPSVISTMKMKRLRLEKNAKKKLKKDLLDKRKKSLIPRMRRAKNQILKWQLQLKLLLKVPKELLKQHQKAQFVK